MKQQPELKFSPEPKKPDNKKTDEFAASCRPLAELLDSVRQAEGFPVGSDEDILELSDPPYYTACPNPYINSFIEQYSKPYVAKKDKYKRVPFVADVSEGKNDPIYNAHSYHTKVPHKAIMPFIEHYTEPGDIVFDGFCGTGMTGVAAHMLGRKAILCDLSPVATHIAYNYNTPVDVPEFEYQARKILAEVEHECGWMYETLHTDGKTKCRINYVVWSDVLICPYCISEYTFWNAAVDKEVRTVIEEYNCPHCKAVISKRESIKANVGIYDQLIGREVTQIKQIPVLINYTLGKKRCEKAPDAEDIKLMKLIEESAIPYKFPINEIPQGDKTGEIIRLGITNVHHLFTKRNLWILSSLLDSVYKNKYKHQMLFLVTSFLVKTGSRLHNIGFKSGKINLAGAMPNALYLPSLNAERNILELANGKLKDIVFAFCSSDRDVLISTNSSDNLLIKDNSIDYIFVDPPFGSNLMYSELNYVWEAWIQLLTNSRSEAVINQTQSKNLNDYKNLMTACFVEFYRILKPNRWITIEFHNSKAEVWNAIQDSISKAGFVVAQVVILNKKQGTYNQMVNPGSVGNDPVINAYKPRQEFEEHFLRLAGEGLERDFIYEHLDHLPIEVNIERTQQMLYSKMLAHYVQRGYEISMNSNQFYSMLRDHFKMIDGYWFNNDQVFGYEEWKKAQGLDRIREIRSGEQLLFISDEKSLLVWLYQFLETSKTYSDIYTASRKIISGVEDEIPELRELLDQNFIIENGNYRRPRTREEEEKIEAQRQRNLLRSFEQILTAARTSNRKLKEVRKEAIILGFTQAYREKRFEDIMTVAQRLDPKLINSNGDISDFVEIAQVKTGADI